MRKKEGFELLQHPPPGPPAQESSIRLLEHTTRNKFLLLKNNMKLLLVLYFLPLVAFILSVAFSKWIEIILPKNNMIWLGLYSVFLENEQESYSIGYFQSFICQNIIKSQTPQECLFLKNFRWAGVVSLLFIGIGFLSHIYVIFQLVLILTDHYVRLKPKLFIKLKTLQFVNLFTYLIAFFIWLLASGCIYFDLSLLGPSFYLNLGGIVGYFLLLLYFLYLKKKIKTMNRITDYLWR